MAPPFGVPRPFVHWPGGRSVVKIHLALLASMEDDTMLLIQIAAVAFVFLLPALAAVLARRPSESVATEVLTAVSCSLVLVPLVCFLVATLTRTASSVAIPLLVSTCTSLALGLLWVARKNKSESTDRRRGTV